MAKKATSHDAQVLMQLYDLRREPEMRKARHFITAEFWPNSAEEVIALINAFPSQENAWLRQVNGYWDMATSLVLHGAVNEGLFIQPGMSGEMTFVFAKVQPFLKEIRQKLNNPDLWGNIEKVATGSKIARKRLERMLASQAQRRKDMAAKKSK